MAGQENLQVGVFLWFMVQEKEYYYAGKRPETDGREGVIAIKKHHYR